MFSSLKIENFKCLGMFHQDLGSLTLLTGVNAAGKSSVVQSLALLRQTAVDNEWSRALHLNGSSVQLGTMYDVIDRNSGGSGFRFALQTPDWTTEWQTTSIDRKRDLVAQFSRIHVTSRRFDEEWTGDLLQQVPIRRLIPEPISQRDSELFEEMQFKFASICHVGAERIGPREVYVAQTPLLYPDVGSQGERTAWCLEQFADSPINPSLELSGVPKKVRLTVQAWMDQLMPGLQLEIKRVDAANLLTMGIRTSPRGDFFRPTNVGFGLTHVLPIVTACVAADPGRLIIIENPETHLHPAAQSFIGSFLATAAAAGVQLIVETHSDHVLNGVRRAVSDKKLSAAAVKIYFFHADIGDAGETRTLVNPVAIDESGRLYDWPTGFFDQMEVDLDYIFRT
jgi:predicted ATPase